MKPERSLSTKTTFVEEETSTEEIPKQAVEETDSINETIEEETSTEEIPE